MQDYPDWLRAMTLVGRDPVTGEPVIIAADEHGYLASYVLDDESQWGDVIKVGNAELAARLGSVLSWDWRGQVQVAHDFSRGFDNLVAVKVGLNAAVALDPTLHVSGGYSVKLTAGSDDEEYASLRGRSELYPALTTGLSVGWLSDGSPMSIRLQLTIVHAGTISEAFVRYNFVNDKFEYYDFEENWQEIAALNILQTIDCFHRMKVVADITNGMYLRALFDDHEYPLPTKALRTDTDLTAEHVKYEVACYGYPDHNDTAHIDMLILTANEPA